MRVTIAKQKCFTYTTSVGVAQKSRAILLELDYEDKKDCIGQKNMQVMEDKEIPDQKVLDYKAKKSSIWSIKKNKFEVWNQEGPSHEAKT